MIDLADPNLDPTKLSLKDKIDLIRQYGELVDLLKGEKIDGNLCLRDCYSLKELPDLKVGRNLDLCGCCSLIKLPDNLKINGTLNLGGCSSLRELPDNLEVGGILDLTGCSSLRELPDDLEVGRDLFLIDCSSLPKELPKTIEVRGTIFR
jgi:hypothetical protein